MRRPGTQFMVGAITLILLALFMFSSTDGDINLHGDDGWITSHLFHFHWNYFKHANRGYVVPIYTLIFDMTGQNSQRTHVFFFCQLVIAGLLLYAVLNKLLGPA